MGWVGWEKNWSSLLTSARPLFLNTWLSNLVISKAVHFDIPSTARYIPSTNHRPTRTIQPSNHRPSLTIQPSQSKQRPSLIINHNASHHNNTLGKWVNIFSAFFPHTNQYKEAPMRRLAFHLSFVLYGQGFGKLSSPTSRDLGGKKRFRLVVCSSRQSLHHGYSTIPVVPAESRFCNSLRILKINIQQRYQKFIIPWPWIFDRTHG